jgi:hypothetical protein
MNHNEVVFWKMMAEAAELDPCPQCVHVSLCSIVGAEMACNTWGRYINLTGKGPAREAAYRLELESDGSDRQPSRKKYEVLHSDGKQSWVFRTEKKPVDKPTAKQRRAARAMECPLNREKKKLRAEFVELTAEKIADRYGLSYGVVKRLTPNSVKSMAARYGRAAYLAMEENLRRIELREEIARLNLKIVLKKHAARLGCAADDEVVANVAT